LGKLENSKQQKNLNRVAASLGPLRASKCGHVVFLVEWLIGSMEAVVTTELHHLCSPNDRFFTCHLLIHAT
jgi:hypothetical protein